MGTEHLNISDNLLQGRITEALFACQSLKDIDLSRNNFMSSISPTIGDLKNLKIVRLNQNNLAGSIPVELFNAHQIDELMIQSNQLTGTIPTQIGNLKSATILTMNHNSLKGSIPIELQHLENLKLLQLHRNQLTGKAPKVSFKKFTKDNFITDCGNPSFLLGDAIDCETCTMCCNSEKECQERMKKSMSIWKEALYVAIMSPLAVMILGAVCLRMKRKLKSFAFVKARDSTTLYDNQSVYCFVFSKKKLAWVLYFVTAGIQLWLFVTYLTASNVSNEDTDFQFNFRCLGNSFECIDENDVSFGGWILFFVVLLFYLGRDLTMSSLQLFSALAIFDLQLFASGIGILVLTLIAIVTSFNYNFALAEKNTDLVMNAVILLFINDLDEHFLSWLKVLVPGWTNDLLEEVEHEIVDKCSKLKESLEGTQANNSQTRIDFGRRMLGIE